MNKQLVYPRLNKYYKINSIIFKDYYIIPNDDLEEDSINYNVIHFDFELELLQQISPVKNYKRKCSFANQTEMCFNNNYFISRIEYTMY